MLLAEGEAKAGFALGRADRRLSGTTVVITTQDLPDHKSPYWGTGNAMYEAPLAGMSVNPNRISAQTITMSG